MIVTPSNNTLPQGYYNAFVAYYEALLAYERERDADIEAVKCKRPWDYCIAMYNYPPSMSDVVLDVGCGKSNFMLLASLYAKEVHGIDDASWEWAADWIPTLPTINAFREGRAIFHKGNAAKLPYPDAYFDKIYTFSALEHFTPEDEASCVQEIRRVLKPDGVFCGTVDFNPTTTNPDTGVHVYDRCAFYSRVIKPGGFKLLGVDLLRDEPVPESVDYIASSLFFGMGK